MIKKEKDPTEEIYKKNVQNSGRYKKISGLTSILSGSGTGLLALINSAQEITEGNGFQGMSNFNDIRLDYNSSFL